METTQIKWELVFLRLACRFLEGAVSLEVSYDITGVGKPCLRLPSCPARTRMWSKTFYVKEGGTPEEFEADKKDCLYEMGYAGTNPKYLTFGDLIHMKEDIHHCLPYRKGWRLDTTEETQNLQDKVEK